jgi:hypothetical protein
VNHSRRYSKIREREREREREEEMERYEEEEYLACCGSTQFAKEMVKASPFASVQEAVSAARDIWFNKVPPSLPI